MYIFVLESKCNNRIFNQEYFMYFMSAEYLFIVCEHRLYVSELF